MKGVRVVTWAGGYVRDADGVVWTAKPPPPGHPDPVVVGRRARSARALRWTPCQDDVYWPESVADVVALARGNAGLVFTHTPRWHWPVMLHSMRLTLENRAAALGAPPSQFGREAETSPGYFFGWLWHDGGKWMDSPPMREQRARGPYKAVIDRAWLPEIREIFGFRDVNRLGPVEVEHG